MHNEFKVVHTKTGLPLPVDFLLVDQAGRKLVAIELDGIQHFKFVEHFHKSEPKFEYMLERDCEKEQLVLAEDIPLVRILQIDVYRDRLDWGGYLIKSIAAAIAAAERGRWPLVYLPDRSEYSTGAFWDLRRERPGDFCCAFQAQQKVDDFFESER